MADRFVLVHGAWQTAGTWDLVVEPLRQAGKEVVCATLAGLERDGPGLTAAITLDTHVDDVVRLLESNDLHDVTLVGHSYAGMVITGVAERAHDRVAHMVYVDAFVPLHGQSALELLPPRVQLAFREQARLEGDGWRLKGGERQLDLWGLPEGPARDFVRSRLSDFSLKCFEQPIQLPSHRARRIACSFIACVAERYPARAAFARFGAYAQREGWRYHELPTGHDCHVELPDAFTALLLATSS